MVLVVFLGLRLSFDLSSVRWAGSAIPSLQRWRVCGGGRANNVESYPALPVLPVRSSERRRWIQHVVPSDVPVRGGGRRCPNDDGKPDPGSRPPVVRYHCGSYPKYYRPTSRSAVVSSSKSLSPFHLFGHSWAVRWASYGSVNLVLSDDGKPKFEIEEVEPSKKRRYLTKKRLKLQRKREKRKRKEANKNDPRRIRPKGKKIKQKFPTAEARLKYKIEKAKLKEAMLVEKLKKYDVAKAQGPMAKPDDLNGEERFYLKKVSQKKSNYVPVGRRGVFGGVILNMHLHWKKHETVKVICKPCKPGQIQEYASEIARLSGGIPINIIGNDTIVFYRGKNYVQPDVMSPIDTLSKKKALEKSKYEQSLETVRRFIAVSEKELELYYRHVALYGNPQSQNADVLYGDDGKAFSLRMDELSQGKDQGLHLATNDFSDILDTCEFDEEDNSSSECDVIDAETEDPTDSSEDSVVSDHRGF